MIIKIDGESFDINILSLQEEDTFVDKYAERTESYDLERELVGLFINYRVKIGKIQDKKESQRFVNKLREVVPFHEVEMPFDDSTIKFKAYITGITRQLLKYQLGNGNEWGSFEVRFIAKSPQFRA